MITRVGTVDRYNSVIHDVVGKMTHACRCKLEKSIKDPVIWEPLVQITMAQIFQCESNCWTETLKKMHY